MGSDHNQKMDQLNTPIRDRTKEEEENVSSICTPTHTPRMSHSVVEEKNDQSVGRMRNPLRQYKTLKDPIYGIPRSMFKTVFRSRSFPLSHREWQDLDRDWPNE